MMRRSLWALLCAICLWLTPWTAAYAHRMDVAMSVVEVHPKTQKLEVSHRLYAHDLEGALGTGSVNLTWFETKAGEAALRDYCAQNFALMTPNGQNVPLTYVGLELLGDQIAVYFEGATYRDTEFLIRSNFLHERSDAQINYVNVRANGHTASAVFVAGAGFERLLIAPR